MPSPRASGCGFWAIILASLLYVALLSWWSPFTSIRTTMPSRGWNTVFLHSGLGTLWDSYMTWNPRIGEYLSICGGDGRQMALYLAQSPGAGRSGADDVLPGRRAEVNPASRRTCGCSDWAYSCCSPVRPVRVTIYWLSGQPTIPGPPPVAGIPVPVPRSGGNRRKRRPALAQVGGRTGSAIPGGA